VRQLLAQSAIYRPVAIKTITALDFGALSALPPFGPSQYSLN
jgi:hypothetical protein